MPRPLPQPARRAVVYLYTQTGQLREVTDALTEPMRAAGWQIRYVEIRPRPPFPFPWSPARFFGVFPQAVDPQARVELAALPEDAAADHDELVILAYQVWYLAPALPIRSLLKTRPDLFDDRNVVTVIGCRNMWYSAAIEVAGLLRTAGARRVDVVAATDTRGNATTLVTTLRWLLTGRREQFLWFGRAGIGDHELARVAAAGRALAGSGVCPPGTAPVAPALAAADLLAGTVFRSWGAKVRSARRYGPAIQATTLAVFVVGLGLGIAVGLPMLRLAALAGGRRFDTAVRQSVQQRISLVRPDVREAA